MKMKKLLSLLLVAVSITATLAGCNSAKTSTASGSSSGKSAKDVKVALVLGGPITDKSWNETAYNGLKSIEKTGAKVSYVENCTAAKAPDAIRTFASSGYNLIYVNSSAFKDSAYKIAGEFPNVTFVINGAGKQGKNYVSISTANYEQGYIQGILCATMSKKGKVGMICGTEMTPTLDCEAGFYQGVNYVNEQLKKNVVAKVTYLGNYTDTSAGYQTAMSFIAEGNDVMTTVADNASNAVLQACEEKGVLCVGNGIGQNKVAPKTLIAGVKKDNQPTYEHSFKEYLDGTLLTKTGSEIYGANYGVVGIEKYYSAADSFSSDEKKFVEDTIKKLQSGEIKVESMAKFKANGNK